MKNKPKRFIVTSFEEFDTAVCLGTEFAVYDAEKFQTTKIDLVVELRTDQFTIEHSGTGHDKGYHRIKLTDDYRLALQCTNIKL